MYVQIIKGTVVDSDLHRLQSERWPAELKPGASGYLGATWGVTRDGVAVTVVRFDSEADAVANSERPEQGEWWSDMEPSMVDVSFQNCAEVDTMLGGPSSNAGFVQVISGTVKDKAAAQAMFDGVGDQLSAARPDILGGLMAWHGNGGDFTQVMYFRSEAEAHAAETAEVDPEVGNQYADIMAIPPSFLDLAEPQFD